MDIINHSLSDIKNILNEELEKNENTKALQEKELQQEIIENIQINNSNPLSKRTHKTIKSCDENELEKIRAKGQSFEKIKKDYHT